MVSENERATGPGVEPDAAETAIVRLSERASGVVLGAPGTGKTETIVRRVRALVEGGVAADEILVLTPTRQTATALRDRLSAVVATATRGPLARSVASYAFELVRQASVIRGEAPPQLLTGGDQDAILADLLEGDALDAAEGRDRWPASLPPSVRASRAFRGELRTLLAECAERGIDPDELSALAAARGHRVWGAVASFFDEYRYALAGLRAAHREPAELLREAAVLLTGPAAFGSVPSIPVERSMPKAPSIVLVDDAQELTLAGIGVLDALHRRGSAVLAFGDPDISSGAFRGATPELFGVLCDLLAAGGGAVHVLDEPHRAAPSLVRLGRVVTQSIGAAGRVEHRRAPGPPIDDAHVRSSIAPSPLEEVDRIARALREWHVLDDLDWSRMAVIAHDTRQVAELEAELAAREVPTRAAGLQRPLGRERVVRDLAGIVRLGMTAPDDRDPEPITDALMSPFGGLDAVGMRRLRARLRHAELAEGGSRPAAALLAEAMNAPLDLSLLGTLESRAAERLATTLRLISEQAEGGATIHELLWLAWDRARDVAGRRLADVWRQLARGDGPIAAETGRSLDAIVALFDAAKRDVERSAEHGSSRDAPLRFLRRILDADVPDDTLFAPERTGVVTVLTPAAALGTEFDAVIVAGLQEGVWPNVRVRGGLLDTGRLGDEIAAFRAGAAPPDEPTPIDRRRAVLYDELRLFARAVSRARSRLLVTAVDDDDRGPSPLFSLLPEPDPVEADRASGHPLTLRGLVAEHRRTLTSPAPPAARRHAAGQLTILADEGVAGAALDEWYGLRPPSTTAPLRDPDRAPVPVSPSTLTTFADCPLDWAVRALGGDTRSRSAGVGTILHAAMETVPSGEIAGLQAVVDERWGELDFEAPWIGRKEHAWATTLVGRLHEYLMRFHREGGRTIGAETAFRLAIDLDHEPGEAPRVIVVDDERPPAGRFALVSGVIDRVEVYPNGRGESVPAADGSDDAERVVVVDLKTGRSETRVADGKVVDDPQLAAYQLAFLEGLVPGAAIHDNAGARLVVLSKTLKAQPHYRLARQSPLTDETRRDFLGRVTEAARAMTSDRFDAHLDSHCTSARYGVCALHTIKAVSAS